MWADADPDELLAVWAERLAGFTGPDIGEALEDAPRHYRDFPPTLPQFRDLCDAARSRRLHTVTALPPARTAMPEHVREKLREFIATHKAA